MEKLSNLRTHRNRSSRPKALICGAILTALLATSSFGQGVGINTTTPDPSAALDIQATDKGILVPRVSLVNSVDKTTISNPAHGLLVYNTNADAFTTGIGFYYNTGTAQSPNWESISDFKLPVNKGVSTTGTALAIANYNNTASNNTAISATSASGFALKTDGKVKIAGAGQSPGYGKILASDGEGVAAWAGGIAFSLLGLKTDGAHVLAPGTTYKVPFAKEAYDLTNSYFEHTESPSDTFVVPQAGIYHFDAKVSWFPSAPVFISFVLERAGATTVLTESSKPADPYTMSLDAALRPDDKVYFLIVHSGADNITLESSYFNGRWVQNTLVFNN